jgi:ABC-type transport system substrate-binding protein
MSAGCKCVLFGLVAFMVIGSNPSIGEAVATETSDRAQTAGLNNQSSADPNKVLRYAFQIAETGFDPARTSDVYSANVSSLIIETPLTYDFLARPLKLKPNLLEAMPDISEDGTTYTLKFRKGIYFASDPAFNGKPRELIAADYAYSLKRVYDNKTKSPNLYLVDRKIAGMEALKQRQRDTGSFDYDMPCEGLQVLDRYTLRIKLNQPDFIFIYMLASYNVSSIVAREVVEKYGDDIMAHPVGTGPYKLELWKRSSRINLVANPEFREMYWDAEPAPDDKFGQETKLRLQGKRMPMIGRIEIFIIEETQPRWLAFLNEEHDFMERVPEEFANSVLPNNKLALPYAKRGIQLNRVANMEVGYAYFAMENPIVGGYTPEKIALRRAINHGFNIHEHVGIALRNQAARAESPIGPGAYGYDATFNAEVNEYDPARSRALLDLYGYTDRDGDGYRENPDGSVLLIEQSSAPTQLERQYDEVWKKSMDAIGIRMKFNKAQWPDLLKESRAGKLMMWRLFWSPTYPDAEAFFVMLYGPNAGQANHSRFKSAAFDKLYEKSSTLPPGLERLALYREMNRIMLVNAPWRLLVHRFYNDVTHPWVIGYQRHPSLRSVWAYLDIDLDKQKAMAK